MSVKSYRQSCALASALDRVGQRWTMLIIRDLMGGPARFRQLLRGLPGIAPNLLTERLRGLEADGLVRRVSGEGEVMLYALTPRGEALRPALEELGAFGLMLGVPDCSATVRPDSLRALAFGLEATWKRGLPARRSATVRLDVDDHTFTVRISPDDVRVREGAMGTPDGVVGVDYPLLRDLLVYGAPVQRLRDGATVTRGDPAVIELLSSLFESARASGDR